jgi:hypothetical protein
MSRVLILFIVLCSFAIPYKGYCCSCIGPPPPQTALQQAAAVFSGRVTEVSAWGNGQRATLEVEKAWKGVRSTSVLIGTANTGACGNLYVAGERYLVYADSRPSNKGLTTTACGRTRRLKDAQDDLQALGPGEEPSPDATPPPGADPAEIVEHKPQVMRNMLVGLVLIACLAMYWARKPKPQSKE